MKKLLFLLLLPLATHAQYFHQEGDNAWFDSIPEPGIHIMEQDSPSIFTMGDDTAIHFIYIDTRYMWGTDCKSDTFPGVIGFVADWDKGIVKFINGYQIECKGEYGHVYTRKFINAKHEEMNGKDIIDFYYKPGTHE